MTKPHQARNQLLRKIILIPLFTGLVLFLCVQTTQPANDKDNSSLSEDKKRCLLRRRSINCKR
jgi:hypothetical protein